MKIPQVHILKQIARADVRTYPYPHLFIRGIFPSRTYSRLAGNRPGAETYENKSNYPGRKTQVCRDFGKVPLWRRLGEFVRSDLFRDALLAKFNIPYQGRSLFYLHRDLDGFHIRPHTDIKAKLLSYIFYFPDDFHHAHLGTWLMKPTNPELMTEWSEEHLPWAKFTHVTQAPYIPNSLFVWQVTPMSFHAIDVHFDVNDPVQIRHTLRGFVFREDMPLPHTFDVDREFHGLEPVDVPAVP